MVYHEHHETERLILRLTDTTDASFINELLNTPKWLAFVGDREVYSDADAVLYIEQRIMPQVQKLGHSNYTVIRKSDQMKMGSVGLYHREGLEGLDIGFAFLPAFEGMGYAFEAASKILEFGISQLALKQVSGYTVAENLSSQKLLRKLGLEFIEMTFLPNDPDELMLFRKVIQS